MQIVRTCASMRNSSSSDCSISRSFVVLLRGSGRLYPCMSEETGAIPAAASIEIESGMVGLAVSPRAPYPCSFFVIARIERAVLAPLTMQARRVRRVVMLTPHAAPCSTGGLSAEPLTCSPHAQHPNSPTTLSCKTVCC